MASNDATHSILRYQRSSYAGPKDHFVLIPFLQARPKGEGLTPYQGKRDVSGSTSVQSVRGSG